MENNKNKIIVRSVVAFFLFITLFMTMGTVGAGERGVKIRLGNVVGVVDSGLYFKFPLVEKVKKINVKTQSVIYERENPLGAASADLQDVQIATVVNYRVDPSKVRDIYIGYGSESVFEEQVIRPAVRDSVKAVSSQFTAEELVTKRVAFTDAVTAKLTERYADKGILLEQVNITNFQFSESFSAAIEAKVTAVQNAEAQKNKLEQVKYEAQQKIETAKAEAESIRISAQAINSQGGADYVNLKAIEKWNGVLPTQFVPGSAMPFINLNK
mgnify:FL=1